ncbi:helix-turn-helix domain-containing protein [Amycolatopsis cynarae]|uniref:Helix-turn-helix domain-containing protein n=1 Tax=Amycolatopsis cynarae TaxID=2995223 RepID=A0ABY7BB03_9PSEU|nr:helix-turn-helix domain-containing protein [Amycolatopsis sp. HUAS 11-8]WAL69520.1 helix-turn-helix domain-containing protein [Amycolatopsis sp. HUAS 11-8]
MDENVGAQVRAARTARGLSLRSLARALGISPATLSQIENGRTGLSVQRLRGIADALELTVPQILDIDLTREADVLPQAGPPAPPEAGEWRAYGHLELEPVLRGALDEFLAIGYHGATVRGIAARCGLSVAGIYHYHASKQDMLLALLDVAMTELLWRAAAARAEGTDPVERFGLLVENLALFHTHRRELGFLGASEMRSLAPDNRRRIAGLRIAQQRMLDEEAAAAAKEGRFRTGHPREAARAVATMCTAMTSWWRPDGPLTAERIAERYVAFALDLMRYTPGRVP